MSGTSMVAGLMVGWCLLCNLSISVRAQGEQDKWQRVYTGEESAIDVNVSSITTRIRLSSDRAEVGTKVCSAPAYQSKPVNAKEFVRETGISMESIGIKEDYADTIVVKCEASDWTPPQSLLVKLPEGGLLMLWEGFFLVLKKQRH